MAGTEETEVKDVERVEVTPTTDDELVEGDTEDTDQDSSPDNEGEDETEQSDETKPDELVRKPTDTAPEEETTQGSTNGAGDVDDLKEVEGETPVERARRLEITRLRGLLRTERKGELLEGAKPAARETQKDLTDAERAIIGRYKPEEIQALKEVFPVLAKELGFARKDELETNTFIEKSQDVLDTFLEEHPEYLPENDKDNVLWSAFKTEFSLYKSPASPKEYQRILNKVHKDVFGIKPSKGALTTVNAQREKAKTASHAGASSAAPTPRAKPATANPQGLRLDMLKGFSDDDKSDIFGDE